MVEHFSSNSQRMSRRVPIHGYAKFDFNGQGEQYYQQGPRSLQQSCSTVTELNYFDVQLLKEDLCGTGSYGSVCKAMVDQLTCAAKIIHPTFFAEIDPSSTKTMFQFQRECEFMSAIRHPCIVQYLGTTQDIETGLPVLLMELMDESLTQFLGHAVSMSEEVPYYTLVNLCHDVLMALAFLHSNGIVHRDLSSNNILMVAGAKAKVTDFGMAKLIDGNRSRLVPLTQCPGTLVYMPPEALRTPSTYSAKLDVFSLGVVIIQMITCCFPNPGDAKRTVEDSRHGTIEVPILERERRKGDIGSIPEGHTLLGTILDCLADYEGNRPSSKDLCHRMIYYKSCPEYLDSMAEADKKREHRRGLEEVVATKDREIAVLKTELNETRVAYERDMRILIEEKDREITHLREEVKHMKKHFEGDGGMSTGKSLSGNGASVPHLSLSGLDGESSYMALFCLFVMLFCSRGLACAFYPL